MTSEIKRKTRRLIPVFTQLFYGKESVLFGRNE